MNTAPTYGEADLEQARQEGFAAGKQAGACEARQTSEHLAAQSLAAIAERLTGLSQAQAEVIERQGREAIEAAITLVRKLFPKLTQERGVAEVEALIETCLGRLRDEPRVVIRVADSLLDGLQQRISRLAAQAGFDGKIVLLSQDGLQAGDVRVEWADGGAERDRERQWREIDDVIERTIGQTRPRPAAAEASPESQATQEPTSEPVPPDSAADHAVATA
ncbi:MAG: hypothetical protein ACE5KF_08645 [Kiloniellaceae bacterium]